MELNGFFSARGELFWRQLNFLDPWFPSSSARPRTLRPRLISEDDIIHADFAESDQGIVTDVQVRYFGGGGFVQTAVNWPEPGHESAAHKNMVSHLRTRRLVVYAPWILTKPAAQYLAQVLYDQYAAGVAQASVTIPADPLIEIGSLVDVPALGTGGTTRYYVTSCNYQLTWGGAWVMTLGLAFGRAPNQSFPYAGTVKFPALTAAVGAGGPQPARITPWTSGNLYWDESPYAIVAQPSLRKDQAAISSAVYAPGSIIWIYTKPNSTGKLVGPAALGEYTVVAPSNAAQAEGTIALQSTTSPVGYVTVKSASAAVLAEGGQGGGTDVMALNTTIDGTGADSVEMPPQQPLGPASTTALRALQMALTKAGQPYVPTHAGEKEWDCSGLVSWAYAQLGIGTGPGEMFIQNAWGPQINGDTSPSGIYRFMQNRGAKEVAVQDTARGDLLFCHHDDGSWANQDGFSHVCFRWAPGQNYGANSGPSNIGLAPDDGFHSSGAPINKALSLASVDWTQR